MIKKTLLTILFLIWATAAQATTLGDAATALSAGEWSAALTTTDFASGAILRPPSTGSIIEYQDKALWNPINNTVLIFGAAHGNPDTQNQMFAKYTESTNTWVNNLPLPGTGILGPQHHYHHDTIVPATGDLYHRDYNSGVIRKFTHSSQTWSTCTSRPGSQQVAGALQYFPDRDSLIFLDGDWGVWELSLAAGNCAGAWSQRASTIGGGFSPQLTGLGSYHNQAAYSSACSCVILGGGGSSTTLYKYNAGGTFGSVATAPVPIAIPQAGQGSIFTVDPTTGRILVWSYSNAATTMYEYDPSANTWATIVRTSPMFPGPEGGVTETVAIPISTYGVIMFVSAGSASGGQIRLYKHAAGTPDTEAPTTPTNLAAVTASSTQINLTWTVSTDNVGINHYDVQRCSGAACVDFVTVGAPTSNSYNSTGLTAATLYRFQVRAVDSSSNTSSYSSIAQDTTSAADITAPTDPTNLALSNIESTSLTVTWTASTDAVGVDHYALERCSGAGCSSWAVVFSPTSTTQNDIGLSPSTSYSYRIRAYDAAGNISGYSSTATDTTAASGTTGDFATRCAAAGVVRCVSFDTEDDRGTIGENAVGQPKGTFHNNQALCNTTADNHCPTIDTDVKASGAGSLKIVVATGASGTDGGQWFVNFADDYSVLYGQNTDFYVSWRQRFDDNYITAVRGNTAMKQAMIGTGSTALIWQSSCSTLETVLQNNFTKGVWQMYHNCGRYDPFSEGLFTSPWTSTDFKIQNARPADPGCWYYAPNFASRIDPLGNCVPFLANQWVTVKVRIRPGTRVGDYFESSYVDLWVAPDGGAFVHVIAWGPYDLGPMDTAIEAFGAVWFLTYSGGETYPSGGTTWYDELIVSTQDIAVPGSQSPPAPPGVITVGKVSLTGKVTR